MRRKDKTRKEAAAKHSDSVQKSDTTKAKAEGKAEEAATQKPVKDVEVGTNGGSEEDSKKRDGKRKVTFNVQPNVVTIKREVKEDEDEPLPERADGTYYLSSSAPRFLMFVKKTCCFRTMMTQAISTARQTKGLQQQRLRRLNQSSPRKKWIASCQSTHTLRRATQGT